MSLSWQSTSPHIDKNRPELAILPLASMEDSGLIFPQDSNYRIVSEISRQVADKSFSQAFLMPCWPYGARRLSGEPKMTVSLEYETLWVAVKDIIESLLQHSIVRVAVINQLGTTRPITALPEGNEIIKTVVRQLNYEHPALQVIWVQPFRIAREHLKTIFFATPVDLLDDAVRASLLLHLLRQQGKPCPPSSPLRLPGASESDGEQALSAIIEAMVGYIEETIQFLNSSK